MIDWNEPSTLKTIIAIVEVVALFSAIMTAALTLVVFVVWSLYSIIRRGPGLLARAIRWVINRPVEEKEADELNTGHYVAVRLSRFVPRVWPTDLNR